MDNKGSFCLATSIGMDSKEYTCSKVLDMLDTFCNRLDEIQKQEIRASKQNTEVESKHAQELEINENLLKRLEKLMHRCDKLDAVCSNLPSEHTIADSDQARLNNAWNEYEIAKECTGIRFDFSAPPTEVKGYIKSKSRKLLQPFTSPAAESNTAIWATIGAVAHPKWPIHAVHDKENIASN